MASLKEAAAAVDACAPQLAHLRHVLGCGVAELEPGEFGVTVFVDDAGVQVPGTIAVPGADGRVVDVPVRVNLKSGPPRPLAAGRD